MYSSKCTNFKKTCPNNIDITNIYYTSVTYVENIFNMGQSQKFKRSKVNNCLYDYMYYKNNSKST